MDFQPPQLEDLSIAVWPTAVFPVFQLLLRFSEPVSWLADGVSSTPANSSSSSSGAAVTDLSALAAASNAAPIVATFSSSRLLLTNVAILNISAVPGTMATTESGQAMGAATEYTMWLQSWAGAGAVLQVMGAAYQDLAGNAGREDKQLAVSAVWLVGVLVRIGSMLAVTGSGPRINQRLW